MATNPTQPAAPSGTAGKILAALQSANEYVGIGLLAEGVIVPLVKGVITEIKKITAAGGTETYQVVIQTDTAELESVRTLADSELTTINAELTRMGQPTVPVPAGPAPEVPPAPQPPTKS